MTQSSSTTSPTMWVAIDIAKAHNEVLIESPHGRRWHLRLANTLPDFAKFAAFLSRSGYNWRIAFEATGDYHRPLAHFLRVQGFALSLVSSLAVARTRDALYNSRDKNDPKDAQVILHLLKTGTTLVYHDPLEHRYLDLQELTNSYQQLSLWKTQLPPSPLDALSATLFPRGRALSAQQPR